MKFERVDGERGIPVTGFGSSGTPASRRRLVTLAFLSKDIPAALISRQLALSLQAEAGGQVVIVRLQAGEPTAAWGKHSDWRATAVDWAPSEVVLQNQFHLPAALLRTPDGFHVLNLPVGEGPAAAERIDSLLQHLSLNFRYVLIEASASAASTLVQRQFLQSCDLGYLFFRPCEADSQREGLLREIQERGEAGSAQLKLVACLPEVRQTDGFEFLGQPDSARRAPALGFIHDCPTGANNSDSSPTALFRTDVRRLSREISGRLVGLAFGSGAAKGFAHIGVIQVLEENGIHVDVVAGTSIGAYIGALWSFGYDGQKLEALAREMESRWAFWSLLDPVFPPRRGFLRGIALRKRLMKSIGEARFADLARPMRIVAANVATLDRMAFASGEVAAAAHASMAVPGICVPVRIDGENYIDGGIVDPVPVDVLREMGATQIIAVNALPSPADIREAALARRAAKQKCPPKRRFFRKQLPLCKQLNYFAPGNLFEILVRSVHGAQVRLAEASCLLAHVVLRPNSANDRWLDLRNPRRFIALGRHAARQQLDEIKALVAGKQANFELDLPRKSLASVA